MNWFNFKRTIFSSRNTGI